MIGQCFKYQLQHHTVHVMRNFDLLLEVCVHTTTIMYFCEALLQRL
eukprot:UN17439